MIQRLFILWFALFSVPAFAPPKTPDCLLATATLSDYNFTNGELLTALFSLQSGTRPATIHPELLIELRRLSRSKAAPPYDEAEYLKVLEAFRKRIGPNNFAKLIGEITIPAAIAAKRAVSQKIDDADSMENRDRTDLRDMNRGFGFRLLPDHDPAFTDPVYLAHLLASSDANAPGYPVAHVPNIEQRFERAWNDLSPRTRVIDFTITGSDAVNHLPQLLLANAKRKNRRAKGVELVVFQSMWLGSKGLAAELNVKSFNGTLDPGIQADNGQKGSLVPPVTYSLNPSPEEIARLIPIEEATLADLRKRIEKAPQSRPVGGVVLEPIVGAGGVLFFRPEFLMRLRKLCDEAQIPLVADEILTGGGRTGKFFGYEHYPNFLPDLVLFGKGLITAGIAVEQRSERAGFYFEESRGTTINQQPETLLKATQVLTRIQSGNLMQNAAETGAYLLHRMRHAADSDLPEHEKPRGIGLLIYDKNRTIKANVSHGRLMPPLTLTKEKLVQEFFPLPIQPTGARLTEIFTAQGWTLNEQADGFVEWSKTASNYKKYIRLPKLNANETIPAPLERKIHAAITHFQTYNDPEVLPAVVRSTRTFQDAIDNIIWSGCCKMEYGKRGKGLRYLVRFVPGGKSQVSLITNEESEGSDPTHIAALAKSLSDNLPYRPVNYAALEKEVPPWTPQKRTEFMQLETADGITRLLEVEMGWVSTYIHERPKSLNTLLNPFTGAQVVLPLDRSVKLRKAELKEMLAAVEAGTDYQLRER